MADRFISEDQFEIIRDHGAFLVRRNNTLVAEVLRAKERASRNILRFQIQ